MCAQHVLWVCRDPERTYGKEISSIVLGLPPANRTVHNTGVSGRPEMPPLVINAYHKFKAEAVFIVSNPGTSSSLFTLHAYTALHLTCCFVLRCVAVTHQVVHMCRVEGIHAYGAVWDS